MDLEKIGTLLELLTHRAERTGDKIAFSFDGKTQTYNDLWSGVQRFGAYLRSQGIPPNATTLILLPNSVDFFYAFYGVQAAGGIAIPIFPNSGLERVKTLVALSNAWGVVIPSDTSYEQMTFFRTAVHALGVRLLRVDESHVFAPTADLPVVKPDDISFIQYTSGSTGNPKGVPLTHRNLLTNMRQMIAGMQITPQDVFVSWLPIYHDMGLILKTMCPFYLGATLHLLPTAVRNTHAWLEAITRHRATFTAAPDFAYRLCLRYVDAPGEYDLSCLRVALNAAEPVRAQTVMGFEAMFGLKNVMTAGYGLAEATVGVSMSVPGAGVRVDKRGLVSVGHPFPGVEVHIVEHEREQPPGVLGEIAVLSIANASGYWNNPEAARAIQWGNGFILTGDIGYLDDDGYLYIAGRKKSIIKRAGTTIAPQEIDEAVDSLPFIRLSAAIGVDQDGFEGEQVYIFAEVREDDEREFHEMALGVVQAVQAHMGFRPGRVYLLKPRSIPLTHNGKIRHTLLRSRYLDGSLRVEGVILYPEY